MEPALCLSYRNVLLYVSFAVFSIGSLVSLSLFSESFQSQRRHFVLHIAPAVSASKTALQHIHKSLEDHGETPELAALLPDLAIIVKCASVFLFTSTEIAFTTYYAFLNYLCETTPL